MKTLMMAMFALCVSACAFDTTGDQTAQQVPDEELAISDLTAPAAMPEAMAAKLAMGFVPDAAACGRSGPNLQNQVIADAASRSGGANQRSGSSTRCPALGVLQPTDDARYYCWTVGNDGFTWSYARNQRTGVRGWTRDDLLRNTGSNRYCGF
jgi:hypothetical protein